MLNVLFLPHQNVHVGATMGYSVRKTPSLSRHSAVFIVDADVPIQGFNSSDSETLGHIYCSVWAWPYTAQ